VNIDFDINKIRKFLFSKKKYGIFFQAFLYLLMLGIGFVFFYPLLIMFVESLKDVYDIINPLVKWVPTNIYFYNFIRAWNVLGGFKVLLTSSAYMLLIAACQTLSSALIGYGFAKFNFMFKRPLFVLMICTFIIPEQVTFMPKYILFKSYGMLKTIFPFLVPALFGQGIKNTIFILIFYQFFKMLPRSLDEAAQIDGAGFLKIFARINLPLAVPAIVVVFVFSFVWHWNETYLADLYFETAVRTFPLTLQKFTEYFAKLYPVSESTNPLLKMNESVRMAGTLLCIAPLVVLYVFLERYLIASIDKVGITGE